MKYLLALLFYLFSVTANANTYVRGVPTALVGYSSDIGPNVSAGIVTIVRDERYQGFWLLVPQIEVATETHGASIATSVAYSLPMFIEVGSKSNNSNFVSFGASLNRLVWRVGVSQKREHGKEALQNFLRLDILAF